MQHEAVEPQAQPQSMLFLNIKCVNLLLTYVHNYINCILGAEDFYYAVAIVNRTSPIMSSMDFKGKKACFTGVGHMASWVLPISYLLDNHIMDIYDCNNHLKSVSNFFGSSCAPNALIDKNNPTG